MAAARGAGSAGGRDRLVVFMATSSGLLVVVRPVSGAMAW
jgi:hypothetical protein